MVTWHQTWKAMFTWHQTSQIYGYLTSDKKQLWLPDISKKQLWLPDIRQETIMVTRHQTRNNYGYQTSNKSKLWLPCNRQDKSYGYLATDKIKVMVTLQQTR